ncbi:efflux RND transporter permease subunit [Hwanghaeella grinnelliae]|uniref:Efflux RND transporter permease subunit n=1 Tax=Hwanghaeella grinnelliae TaxID=2500179 RepID=A0A437QVI9_9PROT|nr:efflux RND transporter permease subunit [Hwanghaeella grinnelliae]RVU38446.1 efflux RND transporter permease subunit [Hwanghaeella grinnelliae]
MTPGVNLTAAAFDHKKLVCLVIAILLIYGAFSYFTLPAREDPEITIRGATVTTRFPGMAPDRVELLITKKLEEAIRTIPQVEEIRSTSTTGLSIIHVEIMDRFFALEDIWSDLRAKVSDARGKLPDGAGAPQIDDDRGDVSIITLALLSDGFEMGQMYDVAKHVRDTLYLVNGTKRIDLLSVQYERVFLEVSNARLAQLGLSPFELISALRQQNIIRPGGNVNVGPEEIILEPTGNYQSVDDIGETLITLPNNSDVIPLKDIVSIRRDYADPPERPSYFNGEPAIMFAISMLSGQNVLEYAPRMKAEIQRIEDTLPIGYELKIATYQADQVRATIDGVSLNVVETLAIVLVVVMVFLGVRTGAIVGAIVPCVMLGTLGIMSLAGMELQRMSLATLIIALGLLVDNGIVVAEDFKRRLESGMDRYEAMVSGGRELAIPLLTSTLTTILVFMPLMLAEHMASEYTRSISLVILISLMASWVLALCATPLLCYAFIKVRPVPDNAAHDMHPNGRLFTAYAVFLKAVLRFKIPFLVLMVAALAGTVLLFGQVPKQFFPNSDRSQVLVYIDLPAGTPVRYTNTRMQDIFAWLDDRERFPHIESHVGYVGYGGPRFVLSLAPIDPADNKGFIVLNIDEAESMDKTIAALQRGFIEDHFDLQARVKRMFLGPSDSSEIEVQVIGPDAGFIFRTARQIEDYLSTIPGTIDIRNNWENRIMKVLVRVDQQRARRAGVTSEDIAISLQGYFDGTEVTELREGDDIIPIVFRGESAERLNLDRMRTLNVYSQSRRVTVPLIQVADFVPDNQYARIVREDLFRTVSVQARSTVMTAEDLADVIDAKIVAMRQSLPPNHSIEYDGVVKESADAQAALSANVPVVLGVIVLLLVAQFGSYRRPLIIALTIPLSAIGAIAGLLVMQAPFGFMVTLGIYSLAGIIINNAIVLIDRIDIERAAGKTNTDAIIDACLLRVRPIAMTTITTILGLMPLIVTVDPLFYGMACVIAFGLGIGTLLTLGVVPALFALLFPDGKTG